mgnify:CR=1 FL=1
MVRGSNLGGCRVRAREATPRWRVPRDRVPKRNQVTSCVPAYDYAMFHLAINPCPRPILYAIVIIVKRGLREGVDDREAGSARVRTIGKQGLRRSAGG